MSQSLQHSQEIIPQYSVVAEQEEAEGSSRNRGEGSAEHNGIAISFEKTASFPLCEVFIMSASSQVVPCTS